MTDSKPAVRNPWAWVPSLYLAESVPYVMVMTVSVIMYKRLGISNTDIALYTSWLYLPWVIKPLWSPFVDMFKTKRLWILVTQALIGVVLACVALTIPASRFFQYTIGLFWLMAFCSATHDIAADGFYMLGLREHQQAAFVGVRSTFYRIGTIAAQGLLVIIAGTIESHSGLPPVDLKVVSRPANAAVTVEAPQAAPTAGPALAIITEPAVVEIGTAPRDGKEVKAIVDEVRAANIRDGHSDQAAAPSPPPTQEASWWQRNVSAPWGRMTGSLEAFLREHFGDTRAGEAGRAGNVSIVKVRLSAAPEPGRNVVVVISRASGDPNIEILEGGRLVFNERNWDKPAGVVLQLDSKVTTRVESVFRATAGNIPLAWSSVFFVLAGVYVVFYVYHKFILPYPPSDRPAVSTGGKSVLGEFFHTFVLFFKKKDLGVLIAFLLFYRFAEAQLVKMVSPFLLDPREIGGLGLTTSEVGWVYGTVGIGCLMIGGLAGGYLISQQGLRFWLWPMVIIMHSPDLMFVYLSYAQPENLVLINAAVAIEQFGYGFGFTAYMLYMIMVVEGEHKTAHFAICTGIMALGMMLPGMWSGWLQDTIGYRHFFLWVVLSTIPGFLVAALVKIDPGFGRKKAEAAK